MTITAADSSRADALTAIMRASQAYHGQYSSVLDLLQITPDDIARRPTFMAMSDGEVVGFYSLITGRRS